MKYELQTSDPSGRSSVMPSNRNTFSFSLIDHGLPTPDHRPRGYGLRPRPFTLIELLVVVGIMAMLMYIALPAFTKLAKGTGVGYEARNLQSKLKLARTYAISNRQYVAMLIPLGNSTSSDVFPSKNGSATDKVLPDKYYNSSYRVCIVDKDKKFVKWIDGESWTSLQPGLAFLQVQDDSALDITSPENDGTKVSLVLGNATDTVDCQDISTISGAATATNFTSVIFKPNGKCVKKAYISIGEGNFSGSTLTVTNRNAGSYLTIGVDEFTGRITYYPPGETID